MSTITSVPHGILSDADATTIETDVTKPVADVSTDATAPADNGSTTDESSEITMAEHFYRYKVQMNCGGCSGAITRVLTRAQEAGAGVISFDVSLENQSVEVRGPIDFALLTEKIEKTGKKILEKEEVIETPAAPEVEVPAQPVAVA